MIEWEEDVFGLPFQEAVLEMRKVVEAQGAVIIELQHEVKRLEQRRMKRHMIPEGTLADILAALPVQNIAEVDHKVKQR